MITSTRRKRAPAGGSGADDIALVGFDDQESGKRLLAGVTSVQGQAARPLAIMPLGGVSQTDLGVASAIYPPDGDGLARGGAAGYITLAANQPANVPLAGLGVLIYAGTGAGQWRRIGSFDTGNGHAVPTKPWAVAPDNTSRYVTLILTWLRNELIVRGEYEGVGDGATIEPWLASYPTGPFGGETGILGGAAMSVSPQLDTAMDMPATLRTFLATNVGYKLAQSRTIPCRGSIGAKLFVTPPVATKFYVEAGAI